MKDVTVTALQAFEYEGRRVPKGHAVEMSPVDAALLHRRGLISLTRKKSKPEPEPPRQYRRRDLTAQETREKPKPKRQYRRRDLVPEQP